MGNKHLHTDMIFHLIAAAAAAAALIAYFSLLTMAILNPNLG
jgi:hypothetical protein